jgi:hypothetical protein
MVVNCIFLAGSMWSMFHFSRSGDADAACEAAGDAIDFLARQGLDPPQPDPVDVPLVRELKSLFADRFWLLRSPKASALSFFRMHEAKDMR